jgi:ribosome recycling factor
MKINPISLTDEERESIARIQQEEAEAARQALRDDFAKHAMQALTPTEAGSLNDVVNLEQHREPRLRIARVAYLIANEMLKVRLE